MSRIVLIITALVVGAVLAVGGSIATSALLGSSATPSNQAPYSYGG
ncbi:MAG: hypothetical protein ACLQFR_08110 [Streptosporangiaceae bacterium]